MTRLIDVDKLKQYIDDCECCEKCDMKGFRCDMCCELPDCVTPQWERVLNEQPTVDVCPTLREKALLLLVTWAEECGFGYDNFPEEYETYKDEIEGMGYIDGMIYIAERVVENETD